jgi:hypothetical protein
MLQLNTVLNIFLKSVFLFSGTFMPFTKILISVK